MRVAKKNKAVQKKTARSGMSENKAAWQNSLSVHRRQKRRKRALEKNHFYIISVSSTYVIHSKMNLRRTQGAYKIERKKTQHTN